MHVALKNRSILQNEQPTRPLTIGLIINMVLIFQNIKSETGNRIHR